MTMETYNCEYFTCDIKVVESSQFCDGKSPNGTSYDKAKELAIKEGWVFVTKESDEEDGYFLSMCPDHIESVVMLKGRPGVTYEQK